MSVPFIGLHITAPPRGGVSPSARALCRCGWSMFGAGRARALATIAEYARHRDICELHPGHRQEVAA